jgi:hypothetical protein
MEIHTLHLNTIIFSQASQCAASSYVCLLLQRLHLGGLCSYLVRTGSICTSKFFRCVCQEEMLDFTVVGETRCVRLKNNALGMILTNVIIPLNKLV